jgi:hypothetical protein
VVCIICGRSIQQSGQGRRRLYCSNACRQRAFRQRDEERMWRGTDPNPDDLVDVTTILNAALKPPRRR